MIALRNNQAKSEILASIRGHLTASAPFDAVQEEHHGSHGNLEEEVFAPAASPTTLATTSTGTELVEMFRENLEAVGGKCSVVNGLSEALEYVREIIEAEKPGRVAISDSFLLETIKDNLPGEIEILELASKEDLFGCDIGITGAQWGIAETGTLVLESNEERNRLASLVPPVHIAVVEAKNIRQRMSDILTLVSGGEFSRAVTFITGPSRTSDIELTLAIGVHGPRELHVIIVSD